MNTIKNLVNKNGRAVANQFVITDWNNNLVKTISFQSYDSLVCKIELDCGMGYDAHVIFGRDYDYSRTTMKHLISFMSDIPCTSALKSIADVRKAIEKGYYNNEAIRFSYDPTMY